MFSIPLSSPIPSRFPALKHEDLQQAFRKLGLFPPANPQLPAGQPLQRSSHARRGPPHERGSSSRGNRGGAGARNSKAASRPSTSNVMGNVVDNVTGVNVEPKMDSQAFPPLTQTARHGRAGRPAYIAPAVAQPPKVVAPAGQTSTNPSEAATAGDPARHQPVDMAPAAADTQSGATEKKKKKRPNRRNKVTAKAEPAATALSPPATTEAPTAQDTVPMTTTSTTTTEPTKPISNGVSGSKKQAQSRRAPRQKKPNAGSEVAATAAASPATTATATVSQAAPSPATTATATVSQAAPTLVQPAVPAQAKPQRKRRPQKPKAPPATQVAAST